MNEREYEAVFIASNVREVKLVQQLLSEEGIEYNVRPEQFRRGGFLTSGSSFNGLMFEVLGGQAEYCRRLLEEQGLRAGVVRPGGWRNS